MAGLDNENVRAAHIFQNLKINFAIAEAAQHGFAQRHVEMPADGFGQHGVRRTRKNFETLVVHEAVSTLQSLQAEIPWVIWLKTLRINREAHQEQCDSESDGDTNRARRSRKRKSDQAETQQRLGAP